MLEKGMQLFNSVRMDHKNPITKEKGRQPRTLFTFLLSHFWTNFNFDS